MARSNEDLLACYAAPLIAPSSPRHGETPITSCSICGRHDGSGCPRSRYRAHIAIALPCLAIRGSLHSPESPPLPPPRRRHSPTPCTRTHPHSPTCANNPARWHRRQGTPEPRARSAPLSVSPLPDLACVVSPPTLSSRLRPGRWEHPPP
ncbi:hypothetical protein BV20DRAFT_596005 [Pilatotrama ljubarskyi]|nr:hypothetical protein BV20DRAFT_596005 [Pilatotrama ljubarskyi]